MGTIAEKLTYLNTTKTKLKDSLNKFGFSILSTDTFRSYDTKLNEIYDKLPKVTQSGAGFTLENVQNGQVDDFKMIGVDLEQDTTTGKNILPQNEYISSTTINGITYTNNGDGTFSLSGTATAETSIRIIPTEKFNLNNGQQYYLYSSLPYNSSTFNMSIVTLENGTQNYLIANNNYTPATTPTNSRLQFYIAQGNTVNAQNIKLMLVKGNNDTNYEPYTGGIPSPNSDYPQEIKVVEGRQVITDKGKNLFDINSGFVGDNLPEASITSTFNEDGTIIVNGTKTADYKAIKYEVTLPAGTYYFCGCPSGGSNNGYSAIVQTTSSYTSQVFDTGSGATFTLSQQTTISFFPVRVGTNSVTFNNTIFKPMISTTPITYDDYEPYYNPVSYNIDLNLENIYLAKMPNTTYKNRIYKNNGNWYFEENVKKVVLDGSEDEVWTTYKNSIILNGLWSGKPITMCDSFKETTNGLWVSDNDDYRGMCSSLNTAGQFRCMPLNDMTLSDFKTWLSTHNVTLWYPLDNPITTQITNTTLINQLEAISVYTGTNIIELSSDNNMTPQIEITRLKELEKLS